VTQPVSDDEALVWTFRSVILDRLEEYFVGMRRLKRHDPTAYALYSRVGFAIPPEEFAVDCPAPKDRVSFGGCSMARVKDEEDSMIPSFFYFRKLTHLHHVQAAIGDIYELTALYDDRTIAGQYRASLSVPLTLHLCIAPDGTIRVLKEQRRTYQRIFTGRKRGRRGEVELSKVEWRYPAWAYKLTVKDSDRTALDLAPELLRMALSTYARTRRRMVIQVRHGSCRAAFGIDLSRAPYFFRDRESDVLAADGKRKRIFHSVVAHDRLLASDRTTRVKAHYRGLRNFTWNGYGVHIVLPSNKRVLDFPTPGTYASDLPRKVRDQYMDDDGLGRAVQSVLEK
jgi:hypothetical protein